VFNDVASNNKEAAAFDYEVSLLTMMRALEVKTTPGQGNLTPMF
jgi:hypothetical protein